MKFFFPLLAKFLSKTFTYFKEEYKKHSVVHEIEIDITNE